MGGSVFVPPEFHFGDPAPPHGVYIPPVPVADEGVFIPPAPSPRSSRTPTRSDEMSTTESSPRPGSQVPLVIPGPAGQQQVFPQPMQQQPLQLQPSTATQPPILVYPPSQAGSQYPPPQSRPSSRSSDRSPRSASPPLPVAPSGYGPGGPTIINIPGQQPAQQFPPPQGPVSYGPSTHRESDPRGQERQQPAPTEAQPPPVVHVLASPQRPRSDYSDYDDRPELPQQQGQQQPIIIHPPLPQPSVHMGPYPPVGPVGPLGPLGPPGVILQQHPGERSSRSTTPTRSSRSRSRSPRSTQQPIIVEGGRTSMPPQFPVGLPPGGPIFPAPHGVGFGPGPAPQPITVVAPSHPSYRPESYRPESPYRGGTPESPRSAFPPPSRTPSRYSDHPGGPIHPMATVPTAVHIVPSEQYPRSRRGRPSGSRTPSSDLDREDSRERRRRRRRDRYRTPSTDTEEEERRRRRRERRRQRRRDEDRSRSYSGSPRSRRRRSPDYYSPSRIHPIPTSSEYGPAGPAILPPQSVTHVHTYPPRGGSPSIISGPLTEGGTEPLQHPYGPPSQYAPSEPMHVPVSRAASRPTRPSRAPTVVEVTGPEHIRVHPPGHDPRDPRGESTRKYRTYMYSLQSD